MADLIKSYTFGEAIAERTPVKFSEEGTVVAATDLTDKICGVTVYAGATGAKGDVMLFGLGLVKTKGAITAGDYLVADSTEGAKALPNDAEGTVNIIGQVLETASADAELWAVIKPHVLNIPKTTENTEETT